LLAANEKTDKWFYEILVLSSWKTLSRAFEDQEQVKLKDEISRLFRSNAFNICEREA